MIAAPEVPSRSERGGFRETVYAGKYTGQLAQKGLRDTSLPAIHPMQLLERLQRAVQMARELQCTALSDIVRMIITRDNSCATLYEKALY